ncbi:DL-endopeptidase inhibitor IseA family protein [Psychrobacillus sp. FSL W7-1457]|uniref:DL-endopeptidase inhibitor IseA family protein n=1 Tax=unclassified Psychrobacillus TaxID=2636677 RepID=UPI0030F55DFE
MKTKTTKFLIAFTALSLLNTSFVNATEAQTKNPTVQSATQNNHYLTDKVAIDLAAKYHEAYLFISSGGGYQNREYNTFLFNDLAYRYLSSKIDTKGELMAYLTQTMTSQIAEQLIEDLEIIEYKGKLAQQETDIGSLEDWGKANAEIVKKEKNKVKYRITVPLGESIDKIMYIVEYQFVENIGWRVNKKPVVDLNIPDKINPIHTLFANLTTNSSIAQNQLLPTSYFDVSKFKKGIKKMELSKLKEVDRGSYHVEFVATVFVELEKDYKGPLVSGENRMYFIVQPNGYMDFKIHQVGQIEMY